MHVASDADAARQTGWKMTVSHTSVLTPMVAGLPPTVDLSSVLADLAENHVSAPEGDRAAVATVTKDARDHGVELSVVIVPIRPGQQAALRDLATEVGKVEHGTVLVLNGDWAGTYSDSVSRYQLEVAEDAAKAPHDTTGQAVQAFVTGLDAKPLVPWTETSIIILLLTVLAVGGLFMLKSRRWKAANR
ncbi:Rv1476 family membrane protein [Nocardia colli]|uniref:Rv1476 family membrane protein n=1 Tax=Nocardia colli TaxID=2545717 RepID=UPI0035DC59D5